MSPRVSFRITTYYKRPRGEPGITQMGTKRIDIGPALDWILGELPEGAVTVVSEDIPGRRDADIVHITIDWSKVPDEIRSGAP